LAEAGSYTYRIQGNQWRSIIIPVKIGILLPIMGSSQSGELEVEAKALIDTGATGSCVSDSLAKEMGIPSFAKESVYSVHGIKMVPIYCINFFLPNGSIFKQHKVYEFHKVYDFDFIIGMNILRQGDMAITTASNETVFSFRIPSGDNHIDFMSDYTAHGRHDNG
jgi:hypothetical protein